MFIPELMPKVQFAIREVRTFLAHSFADEDQEVVRQFRELLEKVGLQIETGEKASPEKISDKIKRRIRDNEIFAVIFTRRDQAADGTFHTATWLIEEKSFAISEGKPLMIFVENGVKNIGGMHADHEFIPFERSNLGPAFLKTIDYALELSGLRMTLSSNGTDSISFNFGGEFLKPEKQLERLKGLISRSSENTTLRIRLAQLLDQMGDHDQAVSELRQLLAVRPDNARAHHVLSQILVSRGRYDEAIEHLEKRLVLEPGVCNSHCTFGHCLLRKATMVREPERREALLSDSKSYLIKAIELAGRTNCKGVQKAQDNLAVVQRLLGESVPSDLPNSFKKRKRHSR